MRKPNHKVILKAIDIPKNELSELVNNSATAYSSHAAESRVALCASDSLPYNVQA